ncbi:DsbA family protein [Halovenus salina]|uniref:DsbA family protein n=1 Tax=Halovenus salina TaxID=1510225 RepID=A0ABD5W392_9EURY|nr:DsbA family protein [Halovenus salina]
MRFDEPSRRAVLAGTVTTLGAGGAYYLARPDTDESDGLSPQFHASEETSVLGVDLAGKPILGSSEAALDVYYWTDFQCPFCEQFERETLPELVRRHVASGRIRIIFVSLPYFGRDSMTAAAASKCVWGSLDDGDRSAYWDWHATVFDRQGEKNAGWAAADRLIEYTRSVSGVDADALAQCLDDRRPALETQVEADAETARGLGVSATPTFVVFDPDIERGGRLVGAQPLERFEEAIERVETA